MTDLTTIYGLRDALASHEAAASVYIDGQPPSALSSYRGYYDHLAIERDGSVSECTELAGRGDPFELNMAGYGTYTPGHSEVRIKKDPTAADLIEALDLAVGEEFEGYKGGQYKMAGSTDLWVSEYGTVDRLRISGIEASAGRIDLTTSKEEW